MSMRPDSIRNVAWAVVRDGSERRHVYHPGAAQIKVLQPGKTRKRRRVYHPGAAQI